MTIALFGRLLRNELRLWWRRTTGVKHFLGLGHFYWARCR